MKSKKNFMAVDGKSVMREAENEQICSYALIIFDGGGEFGASFLSETETMDGNSRMEGLKVHWEQKNSGFDPKRKSPLKKESGVVIIKTGLIGPLASNNKMKKWAYYGST